MDLTTIEHQLESLRTMGIPERPLVTDLARRATRRRNRRRATGSVVAAAALVGLGVGAFRLADENAQRLQTHDQQSTTTSTGGNELSVRVPPIVGKSVGEAAALLQSSGLELSVSDGDAAFTNAVVVAAEPGEAVEVPSGAVVGVRTALPDPPLSVECPLARQPRDGDNADALPNADGLDRTSAEATVEYLRSSVPDTSDTRVFLGIWDRWAYTESGGTITTARTPGFQTIVVTPDASDCATTPTFQAVPVTYVFGDLTWAGDPFPHTSAVPTSQSVEAARRDGVVPEVALMPSSDRVEPHEHIDAAEGSWVLSRLTGAARDAAVRDGCIVGDPEGTYGTDFVCADEYGEILLLDAQGEIVRAYPMPSATPSWIYLTDDAVLVGRIGDGGMPASTLVRIDRQTLAAQIVVFPQPDSEIPWPRGWRVATATQAQAYSGLVAIGPDVDGSLAVSETGRVAIDAAAIEDLFLALG
jgi:hypothetical protein